MWEENDSRSSVCVDRERTETDRATGGERERACSSRWGPIQQVAQVAERAVCTSKGTGGLQTEGA